MIVTQNVSKAYDTQAVLSDISLSVPEGKITSLIGANGAGKSTLLSIISRLMKGEGQVLIDDLPVQSYQGEALSKKLATLRQIINIQAKLTVRELVCFGRYPYSKSRLTQADNEIVEEAIRYMALEELAGRYLDQLSGGERQRAFIAMIIAQDTKYILLDEPLNNLDMKHSVQIMKLLRRLVDEKQKTVVLVIHDINFAVSYSDYIVALKDGRLIAAGSTADIATAAMLEKVYDMPFTISQVNGAPFCSYYV